MRALPEPQLGQAATEAPRGAREEEDVRTARTKAARELTRKLVEEQEFVVRKKVDGSMRVVSCSQCGRESKVGEWVWKEACGCGAFYCDLPCAEAGAIEEVIYSFLGDCRPHREAGIVQATRAADFPEEGRTREALRNLVARDEVRGRGETYRRTSG